MRHLLAFAVLVLLVGCKERPVSLAQASSPAPVQAVQERRQQPATLTGKLKQPITVGDLEIVLTPWGTRPSLAKYHDEFAEFGPAWFCSVDVKNIGKGKIIEWKGWQREGTYGQDEHGNKFKLMKMDGWSWLPRNEPQDQMNGDTGARIAPGDTYKNMIYLESVPATSKEITLTLPLNGQILKVSGRPNLWM